MMDVMSAQSPHGGPAGPLSLEVVYSALPGESSGNLLGAVWHGGVASARGALTVDADIQIAMPPLLVPDAGVMERWCVSGAVRQGSLGPARYRCTSELLFVAITLAEQSGERPGETARDIAGAAQEAYAALFEVMEREGFSHLVRCWNYFADINRDQVNQLGTLERYRLFNIGRQAAFEATEHSADVGAPAACALGTHAGPLTVYALAARNEPRCVENPRQISAYRYPERYGPKSPSFSRGSVLSDADGGHVLFVSGTASIVGHESVHLGDVVAQTEESLRNIVTVVTQANRELGREVFSSHKLCYKVFVRHPDDAPMVADTVRRVLGNKGEAINMVVLRADVCRAELLVEIEAVGFA
jgi:chorismate lyase / 3-hydroxybenzoate synthase